MNAEHRQLFRHALLNRANGAGRLGSTVNELVIGLRAEGFGAASREVVREEIEYLLDKGYVAKLDKAISPEIESFKITAPGRDYLASTAT